MLLKTGLLLILYILSPFVSKGVAALFTGITAIGGVFLGALLQNRLDNWLTKHQPNKRFIHIEKDLDIPAQPIDGPSEYLPRGYYWTKYGRLRIVIKDEKPIHGLYCEIEKIEVLKSHQYIDINYPRGVRLAEF